MSQTVNDISNTWWPEKYRPQSITDYTANSDVIDYVKPAIERGDINHLLFYNEKSGTGKTTLAKIIAKELDADVMYINASDENSIETVREKIKGFASTIGFQKWKIIILDEFSYFSLNAQSALNSMMEQFSKKTRFILTCNYVEKVLPSIQSRCTKFHLQSPPIKDVAKRCADILTKENIKFTPVDLANLIKRYYPDQRTILNELQKNCISGELKVPDTKVFTSDYLDQVLNILTDKTQSNKDKFTNIRKTIADSKVKTFEDLYRFLFDNCDKINQKEVGSIILTISKYSYQDAFVVDKEINAMALIVELLTLL